MLNSAFMALMSGEVTPETERLGVYALAGLVGLVVSGLVTIAKDLRARAIRLRQQKALARLHSFM